jgi:hypothetical protein
MVIQLDALHLKKQMHFNSNSKGRKIHVKNYRY